MTRLTDMSSIAEEVALVEQRYERTVTHNEGGCMAHNVWRYQGLKWEKSVEIYIRICMPGCEVRPKFNLVFVIL